MCPVEKKNAGLASSVSVASGGPITIRLRRSQKGSSFVVGGVH